MMEDLICDNLFEVLGVVWGVMFYCVDVLVFWLGKALNDSVRFGVVIIEVLSVVVVSSGYVYLLWSKIVDGVCVLFG